MSYKREDFGGCLFNPMIEGLILTEYPRLNEIVPNESQDEWLDLILRYVVMAYDPNSPLIRGERDLNYRRDVALDLAGIDDDGVRLAIVTHTHDYSPELILRYLQRFVRSKEYAAIVSFEFSYWEAIGNLLKPISGKTSKEELESVQKKSAIKSEVDADLKRLEILYDNFFGGDKELEKAVKKRITPEGIASGK